MEHFKKTSQFKQQISLFLRQKIKFAKGQRLSSDGIFVKGKKPGQAGKNRTSLMLFGSGLTIGNFEANPASCNRIRFLRPSSKTPENNKKQDILLPDLMGACPRAFSARQQKQPPSANSNRFGPVDSVVQA